MKLGIDHQGLGVETEFAAKGTSPCHSCSRGVLYFYLVTSCRGLCPSWIREIQQICLYFSPQRLGVRMGLAVVPGPQDMPGWRNKPASSASGMPKMPSYPNGLLGCAGLNPSGKDTKLISTLYGVKKWCFFSSNCMCYIFPVLQHLACFSPVWVLECFRVCFKISLNPLAISLSPPLLVTPLN